MIQLTNEALRYIEAINTGAAYYEMTPQEARAIRAIPQWNSAHSPKLASIEDRKIIVRDGTNINVRIYTPIYGEKLPIIVYYHGGGWVFGNLASADAGCQLLADKAQAIIVSVDYRLAPEYPFPIPLHDAYDGLLWAYENAATFGGDPTNITVIGDSAGGNLATVVTYLTTQLNGPKISAQALIYPVTNLDFTTSSYDVFGQRFGLDKIGMQWFAKHYTTVENYANPLISPLRIENARVFPKTIILAAEADVLFDEGLAYAQKLSDAGVIVEHIVMPGLIHSYFSKMAFFENATIETVEKIAAFVK